jgi:hypothetical protein
VKHCGLSVLRGEAIEQEMDVPLRPSLASPLAAEQSGVFDPNEIAEHDLLEQQDAEEEAKTIINLQA